MRGFRIRTALLLPSAAAVALVGGGAIALASWGIPASGTKASGETVNLPAGPVATATATAEGVRVSWSAVPDRGVTYRVNRRAPNASDVQVCASTATTCLDRDAAVGGTYTYVLRVALGTWVGAEGRPSNAVTVTVAAATPSPGVTESPSPTDLAVDLTISPQAADVIPSPTGEPSPTGGSTAGHEDPVPTTIPPPPTQAAPPPPAETTAPPPPVQTEAPPTSTRTTEPPAPPAPAPPPPPPAAAGSVDSTPSAD